MLSGVRILLNGLPENVHWIADVLDEALPNVVAWHEVARRGSGTTVTLEGTVTHLRATAAMAEVAARAGRRGHVEDDSGYG